MFRRFPVVAVLAVALTALVVILERRTYDPGYPAIKASADRYPELEAAIREHHPYELPEIVAVPISDGYESYLDWIAAESGSR